SDNCLDVIQPDVVSVGGITGLQKVALAAQSKGIMFTPHSWGNGIGMIANAHLYAGTSDAGYFEFPWDPPNWSLQRRDYILREPFDVDRHGDLNLSDAPGLGIVLDEDRLQRTHVAGDVIRSNN